MSNHETEQEVIKTDDGFSEKKMAMQTEKVIVQIKKVVSKTSKKLKPSDNVIYEE